MKTFYLTTMIAVFLLLCTNGIQAQTTQTKLNQVELMKQFLGNWKCELGKDTTMFWDAKSYGTGYEGYYKYDTKGKIYQEGKYLQGYAKRVDKYIMSYLTKGKDVEIYAIWFKSNNKYEFIAYSDISNPVKASFKVEGEFKSPDMFVETWILNNKTVRTNAFIRVK